VFAVLALVVMTACSLVTPSVSFGGSEADVAGKWTGSWVGTGLFNSVRQENLTLDLSQSGEAGYGRLVIDNAVAAESVPWQVRQQGLAGIRVFAEISGGKVKLTHEQDKRIFTADLKVVGDQMVGTVRGSSVRMILTRAHSGPAPQPQQSAQVAPPPVMASQPAPVEPTPAATTEPEPTVVAMAPTPDQQESTETPKADDPAQQQQRPRREEFVAAPELKTVHFDFDKTLLRPDAVDALTSNAAWLKENIDTLVLIEGNCDEKGTSEYNLALGDRRAKAAMDYLEANGIAKDRMTTVSYGKERPACSENTEECMKQNRRADFKVKSR
jgi:peptidoglycan-associated lipoprotein